MASLKLIKNPLFNWIN